MKVLVGLKNDNARQWLKALSYVTAFGALFLFCGDALAQDQEEYGLGKVATRVAGVLEPVTMLIMGISYVAGIGFAVAGIIKFKQHKDNPAQVPLGGPIAMIFIAAALIYLPTIIRSTGETLTEDAENSMGKPTGTRVWEDNSGN